MMDNGMNYDGFTTSITYVVWSTVIGGGEGGSPHPRTDAQYLKVANNEYPLKIQRCTSPGEATLHTNKEDSQEKKD